MNGAEESRKGLEQAVAALGNRDILRLRGGFLFKSQIEGETLYLGVIPVLINGIRGYHYSISLPGEDQFTLVGTASVDGSLSILFIPNERDISPGARRKYADAYVSLAAMPRCEN